MSDAGVTVVGQGARLEGSIVSAGSLRIDGYVKGTITADGDVMLSPSSQVEADIHAQNVTVSGRFKGNIVAKKRAELAKTGQVDGNVTSTVLVIAEGARFSGQSSMDGAQGRSVPSGDRPSQAGRDGSEGPQPPRQAGGDGQPRVQPEPAGR